MSEHPFPFADVKARFKWVADEMRVRQIRNLTQLREGDAQPMFGAKTRIKQLSLADIKRLGGTWYGDEFKRAVAAAGAQAKMKRQAVARLREARRPPEERSAAAVRREAGKAPEERSAAAVRREAVKAAAGAEATAKAEKAKAEAKAAAEKAKAEQVVPIPSLFL